MIGLCQDPDVDHCPAAIGSCHRHGGKQRGDETHTLRVRLSHLFLWSGVISIIPLPLAGWAAPNQQENPPVGDHGRVLDREDQLTEPHLFDAKGSVVQHVVLSIK